MWAVSHLRHSIGELCQIIFKKGIQEIIHQRNDRESSTLWLMNRYMNTLFCSAKKVLEYPNVIFVEMLWTLLGPMDWKENSRLVIIGSGDLSSDSICIHITMQKTRSTITSQEESEVNFYFFYSNIFFSHYFSELLFQYNRELNIEHTLKGLKKIRWILYDNSFLLFKFNDTFTVLYFLFIFIDPFMFSIIVCSY